MIPFNLKISSKSHPQDQAKMYHWDSECWKKINGPSPASFLFIYVFFTNEQYHFYNKSMWKMSIQYTILGFEPTTSHNHLVDQGCGILGRASASDARDVRFESSHWQF